MASRTKIVGPAGKFGSRYGRRIRLRYAKIAQLKQKRHLCPYCRSVSVKWVAVGIFQCKKCGAKFSGKAYAPE